MRYKTAQSQMLGVAPLIVAGIISAGGTIISSFFNSRAASASAAAKEAQLKQIAVYGGLGIAAIASIALLTR